MSLSPRIGLEDGSRKGLADLLTVILSDNVVLSMMTRNAHWNVVGPHFAQLHKLFEEQYGQLETAGDDIAERIRALGHASPGSLAEFLSKTTLTELPGVERKGEDLLEFLLLAHESVCRNLRQAITASEDTHGDPATTDFLTGLLESHEKTAWMLRAHLTHR